MKHMKPLCRCISNSIREGFDEDFKATSTGLRSLTSQKDYQAEDLEVVDFYRFEGMSDPADNSILYLIRTNDGTQGTLVDAYGAYADTLVEQLVTRIQTISKKSNKE